VTKSTLNFSNSRPSQFFKFYEFMDWLEELGIRNTTQKMLLGVVAFVVGRFLLTIIDEEAKDFHDHRQSTFQLPASDSQTYNRHLSLSTKGNAGVYQTLDVMAQLVRRDAASGYLRSIAVDLVRQCRGHDADCEIRKCFEFARDAVTYRRDPAGVERVSDARRTIESGVGDCDDKCVVLCSLLAVIGYRTRFVVCGFKPHSHSHVYCEVHTSRGWISLDPTPENAPFGWEQKAAPYRETYEIFR
jgi:transglutaminase-like putative cysteine protease